MGANGNQNKEKRVNLTPKQREELKNLACKTSTAAVQGPRLGLLAVAVFGTCAKCQFNQENVLLVDRANPLDPRIRARVVCSTLGNQTVRPVFTEECGRRLHVANKKMKVVSGPVSLSAE
jgi:C4-type Zn-finger protein